MAKLESCSYIHFKHLSLSSNTVNIRLPYLTSEEFSHHLKKKSIQEATQDSLDDSGVGIVPFSPVKANRYFREHTASKTSV
jgi:hypothetical protein